MTGGRRKRVYGEVVEEANVAIEEKGKWKDGVGMRIVGGCEAGFGIHVIEAGIDGKNEMRNEMGRECIC